MQIEYNFTLTENQKVSFFYWRSNRTNMLSQERAWNIRHKMDEHIWLHAILKRLSLI